jgi:oligopeptide/dipeptide ABC transporter ATP-binding protein
MSGLLEIRDLRKAFPLERGLTRRERGRVLAVDGVDLVIERGTTTGLVGESGSGKSTLARLVLRLVEPTTGEVVLDSRELTNLGRRDLRAARRDMQMVFQDPYSSLDPTANVLASLAEPLRVHLRMDRAARRRRAGKLLELVGLPAAYLERYPAELSGGQLQRVAIARAVSVEPKLVILDEAVSSLDVSTRAQVINLLAELQTTLGISYLFISHDLSVVRHVSHRIAVMYLGRIVEDGPAEAVYERPRHPYTQALLSAIPVPNPERQRARERIVLAGDVPSASDPPSGCHFHTRCPYVMDVCREVDPPAFDADDGTRVFCHLHSTGPALAGASVTELPRPLRTGTEES